MHYKVDEIKGISLWPSLGEHIERSANGVGPVLSCFCRPLDIVDPQGLHGTGHIAETDVADGIFVMCHGLDNSSVGSLEKRPGENPFFFHYLFVPDLVGSGRGITGNDDNRSVRSADLFPVPDLTHIDVFKLSHGEVHYVIAWMHHRHDTVVSHCKRNRISSIFNSQCYFFFFDKAGAVCNISRSIKAGSKRRLRLVMNNAWLAGHRILLLVVMII